jgi:hypothetical protein
MKPWPCRQSGQFIFEWPLYDWGVSGKWVVLTIAGILFCLVEPMSDIALLIILWHEKSKV